MTPGLGEPEPVGAGNGEGGSGVYVHGSAACGNLGSAGGAAGASGSASSGGSSPLPSGFGGQGAAAGSPGDGSGAASAGSSAGAHGAAGAAELGGAAGSPTEPLGHQFMLTEYVEGSSSHKALEITALDDSTFDGCRLAVYFNGATSASGVALEGQLGAGERYVLCTSSLAGLGAACDRTTNLGFNGDDAVALECAGAVVDAIGQVGLDPGTAWGEGDTSTIDRTLRRACSVASADQDPSDPFDPALEWQGFPLDTFDDLGQRACLDSGGGGAGGDAAE